VRGPNFTKLGETSGDHFYTKILFQRLDILLHFQTQAAQSLVTLKTTPNFALFDFPPPVKIRGVVGRDLYTNC